MMDFLAGIAFFMLIIGLAIALVVFFFALASLIDWWLN